MINKYISAVLAFVMFFVLTVDAKIKLPNIFSDNMVLQRDATLTVWGWADKNKSIHVIFENQKHSTKSDKTGYWSVKLSPMTYGGPYQLRIEGDGDIIEFNNILVGEVWLCSGQSNMEMPVNGWGQVYNFEKEIEDAAHYPSIRAFNVKKAISMTPQTNLDGQWEVCSPETVSQFSAVAYFFARKLYKELGIPVGIINSSWGGTDIEPWISQKSFSNLPVDFMSKYTHFKNLDITKIEKENEVNQKKYQEALKNDQGLRENWYAADFHTDLKWKTMPVPQIWDKTELFDADGSVWYRYNFVLPENTNGKHASIHLGPIDDEDITWINGVKIGETNVHNIFRKYDVQEGILKGGKNSIAVKVKDNGGGGGFYGRPQDIYLEIDEIKYPLAGEWVYRESATNKMFNYYPISPNMYHSILYNAMINPIKEFTIKGAIWYQGENNANEPYKYRTLFPTLIEDWRKSWGYEFPFYWVQLASYMAKDSIPYQSDWAELREAQDLTLKLPKTGEAVIVDIGDADDIHPRNKQDVGLRLAQIALYNEYGKNNIIYSGPRFKKMEIENNRAIITFDFIGEGLSVRNKYGYIEGFSVAGSDKKFRWAKAALDGDRVVVDLTGITPPIYVRYGWANNPDINLFNKAGLPAIPFRTDIEK